jgi:hypothetical protein
MPNIPAPPAAQQHHHHTNGAHHARADGEAPHHFQQTHESLSTLNDWHCRARTCKLFQIVTDTKKNP